jgi:hypothetical protein
MLLTNPKDKAGDFLEALLHNVKNEIFHIKYNVLERRMYIAKNRKNLQGQIVSDGISGKERAFDTV